MPVIGPIKRKDLIRYLKKIGFEGPFSGGKHQFMLKDKLRLTLPNPHKQEISQAGPHFKGGMGAFIIKKYLSLQNTDTSLQKVGKSIKELYH